MASWAEKLYWSAFTLWHARRETALPYWPLERILARQNRRVQSIVAHAYATVPYYRETMDQLRLQPQDFRTAADLARLPLISGADLAAAPERFRSRRYAHGNTVAICSNGTTGTPKCIHLDAAYAFMALAYSGRQRLVMRQFVGRLARYRELRAERLESISYILRRFYETHAWTPRWLELERDCLDLADTFERNIARLNAFGPHVVFGAGSYISALFRWGFEHGVPMHRPRLVWYGGERISDSDKAIIEKELGVPVFSTYQAAEALRIGYQCERRQGFHISLDQVALRLVDTNGDEVAPGTLGSVVISNLTNRATVLLNYRLGDWATLGPDPCPCGRTLPTLVALEGRDEDLVIRPAGQRLYPTLLLFTVNKTPGIGQIQIVQEEMERFTVHIVPARHADQQRIAREVPDNLRAILGAQANVSVVLVDALPRTPGGKIRPVISHVAHREEVQKREE